ncbi:MAG: hypothetical protein AB1507_08455 [Bacillota bacterium]|nr:hypothetical protein [Thermoanaerobacteraceae bacterium]
MVSSGGKGRLQVQFGFALPEGGRVIACYPGEINLEGFVNPEGEAVVFGLVEAVVVLKVPGLMGQPVYRAEQVLRPVRGTVPISPEFRQGLRQVAVVVVSADSSAESDGETWRVAVDVEVAAEGYVDGEGEEVTEPQAEGFVIVPLEQAVGEALPGGESPTDEERIIQELQEFKAYLGELPQGRMVISINGVNYVIEGREK